MGAGDGPPALGLVTGSLFYTDKNQEGAGKSFCSFTKEYAEGSGYYGSVFLEKMRFLGSLSEDPEGDGDFAHESEGGDSEGFEIYDPTRDPEEQRGREEMEQIAGANWFWNFVGCADRETNLFFTQKADGIFGIMSLFERFDYRRAVGSGGAAPGKKAHRMGQAGEASAAKQVREELAQIVREKAGLDRRGFYEEDTAPSVMNNLLVQGLVKDRKFSICLGYEKGFLNFDGWNARTLRILNFEQIRAKLGDSRGSEEARALLAELAGVPGPGKPPSGARARSLAAKARLLRRRTRAAVQRKLEKEPEEVIGEDFEELEELSSESSEASEFSTKTGESEREAQSLLEMNGVEDKAIKVLEELSGVRIVRDRIQHIRIPAPSPFEFIYTGSGLADRRHHQGRQRRLEPVGRPSEPGLRAALDRSRRRSAGGRRLPGEPEREVRHGHDDGLLLVARLRRRFQGKLGANRRSSAGFARRSRATAAATTTCAPASSSRPTLPARKTSSGPSPRWSLNSSRSRARRRRCTSSSRATTSPTSTSARPRAGTPEVGAR